MLDPMTIDVADIERAMDEEQREQRWNEFVAWVKQARPSVLLYYIGQLMDGHTDPYLIPSAVQERLSGFEETEGWPGVLSAIARAMREAGNSDGHPTK